VPDVGSEDGLRALTLAPATNLDQPLFHSSPLKQTGRLMVKDENVCLHCGLCAERCPTYAWDMRKFVLEYPHAGVTFIPLEAVGR
jgi:formate dehydrogenase (NADP+) beta subunit